MLTIENTEVFGWAGAIRGMRNPKNSWDKSDSGYDNLCDSCSFGECTKPFCSGKGEFVIGPNDLKLMHTLAKAGHDHGKFLRMIHVQVDITAPLYWWKEADTYKVGTVANSCSTMHKIHSRDLTIDDFSCEQLLHDDEDAVFGDKGVESAFGVMTSFIRTFNVCRQKFLDTSELNNKRKVYWYQLIQMLPTSYNQKRTWDLNYEVLRNIYFARKDHKLYEWHILCKWIEELPYFKEICIDD